MAERGFGGVSVGDIAAAAGFTKGAFYSNFESREAMILALLERLRINQMAALDGLRALAASDLPRTLEAMAQFVARHAADTTATLLVSEVHALAARDPAIAAGIRAGFENRTEVIARWVEAIAAGAGLQLPMPPPDLARVLMALTQGLAQQPADRDAVAGLMRATLPLLLGRRNDPNCVDPPGWDPL